MLFKVLLGACSDNMILFLKFFNVHTTNRFNMSKIMVMDINVYYP